MTCGIQVFCPYCGEEASLASSTEVYGYARPDNPKFWLCAACDAYTGCHRKNSKHGFTGVEPLGTLANAELRQWRGRAHEAFDPLWKDLGLFRSRKKAYAWMASVMNLSKDQAHIGMFSIAQCKLLIRHCRDIANGGFN